MQLLGYDGANKCEVLGTPNPWRGWELTALTGMLERAGAAS